MSARVLSLALLCACAPDASVTASDAPGFVVDGPDYEYILGENEVTGEMNTGGAHEIVDFSDHRFAIDYQNSASSLHPEITGDADDYDASVTSGATDWPVFASSWWPQSKQGIAHRYTGGSSDLGNHTDIDNLSPVEKYDLLFNAGQTATVDEVEHYNYSQILTLNEGGDPGDKHSHPAVEVVGPATKWELENHGNYQTFSHPDSWWGHCNGWASYATTEQGGAPERDIRVKLDSSNNLVECASTDTDCVLFRMGDIEALMTELYFSDTATFSGRRCNTRPDDIERDEDGRAVDPACQDINPGTFHKAVVKLLGEGADHLGTNQPARPAFIIDTNYDHEVWNFPLVEFEVNEAEELSMEEAVALVNTDKDTYSWNTSAVKWVRIDLTYGMVSDGVPAAQMLLHAHDRNIPIHYVDLHYILELDANDTILGGEWIKGPGYSDEDSREGHPDFLWMAVAPEGYGESSDDTGGDNDNPYVSYPKVQSLLTCSNDGSTCGGSAPTPGGNDNNDGDNGSIGDGSVDCGGCAGNMEGPTPWMMGFVGMFGILLRRREGGLPRWMHLF